MLKFVQSADPGPNSPNYIARNQEREAIGYYILCRTLHIRERDQTPLRFIQIFRSCSNSQFRAV